MNHQKQLLGHVPGRGRRALYCSDEPFGEGGWSGLGFDAPFFVECSMRYIVVGSDEVSGDDRQVEVEAVSDQDALNQARADGILATRVKRAPVEPLSVRIFWLLPILVVVAVLTLSFWFWPRGDGSSKLDSSGQSNDSTQERLTDQEEKFRRVRQLASYRALVESSWAFIRQQEADAARYSWPTNKLEELKAKLKEFEREPTAKNGQIVRDAIEAYRADHIRALR